ncbi:hypothetical protein JMJ35_010300 [Cladonia borealis]|uniref:N-acetyltransferase domain-containing protein n=1 Tax=Cladonia borealis TaxID=184061 RepID=A0AA39QQH0_9LECA|nr:hypothetical protein JMJ35_010300 [Cladonia borealis]
MAPSAQNSIQPHVNGLQLPSASYTEQKPPPNATKPLPPNLTIEPVTTKTLQAYRRLITLLLPIRYPDKFYHESLENATPDSIALCVLWHEPGTPDPKVIAGIQCRRVETPISPSSTFPTSPTTQQTLYIQTLATLAPYRSLGVATALLDAVITTAIRRYEHVTSVYAHVWEANTDALEWYGKRGFEIEKGVVEGYYRKLRPMGARIVRRRLGVGDYLGVGEGVGDREDG